MTVRQNYILYSNPSDGNITLEQSMIDEQPVTVIVYNAAGNTVLRQDVQFSGGTAQFRAQYITSGLYLIQIRDSKGRNFLLKFIIQ